jgi:hypothetical protein
MNSFLSSLPILLPVVVAWVEKQEVILCERGVPLNEAQLADARRAGVTTPEKIRLVRVESLPHPENEDVMFVARRIGFFTPRSAGLTLGYAICIMHDLWDDRHLIVHECVHAGQYERMGGAKPFLTIYLRECIDPGYPFGALEQEAIIVSADICKPPK